MLCCNCLELEQQQQEENNNIDKPDNSRGGGNIHIIQLRPTGAVMTAEKGTMTSGPDFSRLSPESFNLTNSFALSSDRSNFELAKPDD